MPTSYDGTNEEKRALELEIKLFRATDTLRGRLLEFFEGYDLTESQFAVLEAVYHLGPLRHCDIAEKMLRERGNITMVVDNLERDGLVERQRSEEDRRVVLVHLTESGRALMEKIFPEFAEYLAEKVDVLSAEEQETLSELCKKLGQSLTAEE